MDSDPSVAEALPIAYRAILDAVTRLEQLGARREAARFRRAAVRTYSGPWNVGGWRRLESLLARVGAACREQERRASRAA